MFVLQIDYDKISSPALLGTNPSDRRELSVFFRALSLKSDRAEYLINFSSPQSLKDHSLFGFWSSEKEGAWSAGLRSALLFEQVAADEKTLVLQVEGNCLLEAFPECRLSCKTSGGHKGKLSIGTRGTHTATLTRPKYFNHSRLVIGDFRAVSRRNNVSLLQDKPRLSVIIPNHQKPMITRLAAIALASSGVDIPYEIICADNGSTNESMKQLQQPEVPMRLLGLKDNIGFGPACNLAIQEARGEFVLLLNNDAFLTEGAIRELLHAFQTHPNCGAVGPVMRYPDGKLQEAGCLISPDGYPVRIGRDDPLFKLNEQERYRPVDYVSGACFLMRRSVFLDLGGFDPVFAPAYYEDTDLFMKLKQSGLTVCVAKNALCYHIENATSQGIGVEGWAARQTEKNRQIFLNRWGCQISDGS